MPIFIIVGVEEINPMRIEERAFAT